MTDRSDLISFFENIADHNLSELFEIIHEIKNAIEFETPSEQLTFECFSGVLWKVTAGATMVREGRNRVFLEDIEEEEEDEYENEYENEYGE
jgi:hypothetical protein